MASRGRKHPSTSDSKTKKIKQRHEKMEEQLRHAYCTEQAQKKRMERWSEKKKKEERTHGRSNHLRLRLQAWGRQNRIEEGG